MGWIALVKSRALVSCCWYFLISEWMFWKKMYNVFITTFSAQRAKRIEGRRCKPRIKQHWPKILYNAHNTIMTTIWNAFMMFYNRNPLVPCKTVFIPLNLGQLLCTNWLICLNIFNTLIYILTQHWHVLLFLLLLATLAESENCVIFVRTRACCLDKPPQSPF